MSDGPRPFALESLFNWRKDKDMKPLAWEVLAFDFGGTKARCALVARDGQLGPTRVLKRPESDDGPRWLERMLAEGRTLLGEAGPKGPRAVGVSFGGPVDNNGRIFSMHVPGWESIDLRHSMQAAFGRPCCIDNDANLGGLGEQRFGVGKDTPNLAYFTVSTGVGGGVVLDGKVYRGTHGIAGEFGHIPVRPFDADAPECACGKRGCVESLASGRAIARDGKSALAALGMPVPEDLTAEQVFAAAAKGDAWALKVRDRAVDALAHGAAAVLCVLDLPVVVIGGGVAQAGEVLFAPLRKRVEEALPEVLRGRAQVRQAALGDFSPLLGAAALALDHLG
ncbi:MAG: ROK family protein [Planctomycetes bacterium]|nr:ROK family protein [Planctomycetota bacterium]